MGQSGLHKSWLKQFIFHWLNWFLFLWLNWFIFRKWANLGFPKVGWINLYSIDWIDLHFFGWTDSYFINGPIWAYQKLVETIHISLTELIHISSAELIHGVNFWKGRVFMGRIKFQSLVSCGVAGLPRNHFLAELNERREFKWKRKFFIFIVLLVFFSSYQCLIRACAESTRNKCQKAKILSL